MSARAYTLGKRGISTEKTRGRILSAAMALLRAKDSKGLAVDAVAARAGVSRMTVYAQFSSRNGLLEALFDALARRGHMENVALAFQEPDPRDAVDALARAFFTFWARDRVVTRKLRALGSLDEDVRRGIQNRDERRRHAWRAMAARTAGPVHDDVVDMLWTLTAFETFDLVGGTERAEAVLLPLIRRTLFS